VGALYEKAKELGCLHDIFSSRNLDGLSPLHLLACWTPESQNEASSISITSLQAAGRDRKLSRDNSSSSSKGATGAPVRTAEQQQAMQQHLKAVQWLLTVGKYVDADQATELDGETPLTFAAAAGAVEVAEALLLYGAAPQLPRRFDAARPLDLAVYEGHYGVACLLLDYGADVSDSYDLSSSSSSGGMVVGGRSRSSRFDSLYDSACACMFLAYFCALHLTPCNYNDVICKSRSHALPDSH
jgi:hypothetical protein